MTANRATRNPLTVIPRVVGSLETLGGLLKNNDGTPFVLTGYSVAFRLVCISSDDGSIDAGTVVVDNEAASIVSANDGEVSYEPEADWVDVAGKYAMYWIASKVDDSEPPRLFPYDGARWQLNIIEETAAQ